jgi:hypothetical protein
LPTQFYVDLYGVREVDAVEEFGPKKEQATENGEGCIIGVV